MKNIFVGLSLLLFLLGLSSCTKYDPIYGVAEIVEETPLILNSDMVYIHDNDVYLTDEILSKHKQLTFSSLVRKTHCVIASSHDRIAYLDANGSPVIIDTLGNQIDHLTQYTNVKDIDWYNGSQTLYILANNQVYFYGQSLNLPTPLFTVFPTDATVSNVDAIHIDESLNVSYTYRYQRPYSQTSSWLRYYYGVAVNNQTGTDKKSEVYENFYNPASSTYSNLNYKYYHKVKFCQDNQSYKYLAIGYVTNGNENNGNAYQLYTWNHTSSSTSVSFLSTPLSQQTYYSETPQGNMNSNVYTLQKYLVNLPAGVPNPITPNTFRYEFTNANNNYPTYFDWKP